MGQRGRRIAHGRVQLELNRVLETGDDEVVERAAFPFAEKPKDEDEKSVWCFGGACRPGLCGGK